MRRLALAIFVLVLLLPAAAHAAMWHKTGSKSLGFTVRYPATWHATAFSQGVARETTLSHQGKQIYALEISVLSLKPGKTPWQTVLTFARWQHGQGNSEFSRSRWVPASMGGRHGYGTVTRPPTEGGVRLSQGIYLVGWHGHIYEVTMQAYSPRSLSYLSQFPSAYSRILATWRFR